MTPLWKNGQILGAGFIKRTFINMVLRLTNHGRLLTQFQNLHRSDPLTFEKDLKKRSQFTNHIHEKLEKLGITALISPFWHHAAPTLKNVGDLGVCGEYSFIWNVTGQPAGIVPVTTV